MAILASVVSVRFQPYFTDRNPGLELQDLSEHLVAKKTMLTLERVDSWAGNRRQSSTLPRWPQTPHYLTQLDIIQVQDCHVREERTPALEDSGF